MKRVLHEVFLKSPTCLFDEFIIECQKWYSEPAHSLTEMRKRNNKKIRGDIFEEFCCLYLKHVKGFEDVWLLDDVPDDILASLTMKRKDMGIDIVVRHQDTFYAVQCKYKKSGLTKTSVTWQALSTFYALCMRTGPWAKYIVMTNCDYIRHQGKKTEKDLSVCLGTFRAMKGDNWLKMCDVTGSTLTTEVQPLTSLEDLRQKRIAYYSKPSVDSNIIQHQEPLIQPHLPQHPLALLVDRPP